MRYAPLHLVVASLVVLTCLAAAPAQGPKKAPPGKGGPLWSLPWDDDWVTAVCFLGPRRIAAGNNLGQILVWNLPEKTGVPAPAPTLRLEGHTNVINRLIATSDGRWLISASNDHTIRYWDMQATPQGTGTVILNARARDEAVRRKRKVPPPIEVKVAVQPATQVLKGHRDWVLGLSLSRDGSTLASGDDKGEVVIWDRAAGKERRRWKVKGWAWALALSPEADALTVSERFPLVFDSSRHSGLKVWDARSGALKYDLAKPFKGQMISAAAYSPDGKTLAVGRGGETDGQNGKVTLLEAATGKKIRELTPGHLNGLTDLVFAPDGKMLYSCGRDTTVRVWNVADGKLLRELGRPRGGQFKDWICAVAVSPDGKQIAGADMAGAVQVWSLDRK